MSLLELLIICLLQFLLISEGLKIVPDLNEVTITSGDDFSLTCENNKPVVWTYPDDTLEADGSKIDIAEENKNGWFTSNLTLHNAYYLNTGYYTCRTKNADAASEIYIYVYDKERLLAVREDLVILSQNEFGDVIIPCKPTSPDVNVTLTSDSDEVVLNLSFDPRVGYTMKSPKVTDSCSVSCTASREFENDFRQFQILVNPLKTKIAKPIINASSPFPLLEGDTAILNCSIIEEKGGTIFLNWFLPNDITEQSGRVNRSQHFASDIYQASILHYRILEIRNISRHDQGNYICKVTDHNNNEANASYSLTMFEKDRTFLNVSLQGASEVTVRAGTVKVQWIVNVISHPQPEIIWMDPDGKKISANTNKYTTEFTTLTAKLAIQNVSIWDSGTYTFVADNVDHRKSLNITLLVEEKPHVKFGSVFEHYSLNETYIAECSVSGYPLPSVIWLAKTCNQYPHCEDDSYTVLPKSQYQEIVKNQYQLLSTYKFEAINTSVILCNASNAFGSSSDSSVFFVTDVRDGFEMSGPKIVALGDDVSLDCGASKYYFTNNISWYYRNSTTASTVHNQTDLTLVSYSTSFSYHSKLNIRNVKKEDSGEFSCQAANIKNITLNNNAFYTLNVRDLEAPTILHDNKTLLESISKVSTGKQVKFRCVVRGIPLPSIIWTKDDKLIKFPGENSRIELMVDVDDSVVKHTLLIKYAALSDDGRYACYAYNRVGNASITKVLSLTDKKEEHAHTMFFLVCGVLAVAFVLCTILLYVKCEKDKKLKKELAETGLLNFEEGAVNSLNPELGVEDQADLLPYDRRWEFPRDKLKLGKQLGSGAFGVVMKAEADGIINKNEITTVAVKMVKRGADSLYIKALASELKIMIHLGRHLNVVNLLGACTRDIHKRELIVIVEYCRYGNLHDFLLKQRNNFINQINEKTGRIDQSIETLNNLMHYDDAPFIGNGKTTNSVEDTPIGSDGYLLNKDNEPDWRSNYRGDYRNTTVKPIKTIDLICWSFQIARGMEYLASRKVLHGDLAARNVLLADEGIVKICDFGLAKSMYNSENYQRRKHELLPVRWMSIESIRDRIFSTQSDVWSFGITLWELFSLSVTPYPGIEHLEVLYSKLVAGHRMEKPTFATNDLYDVMLDCWRSRPAQRPSFTELAERLGNMLEDGVRSHYTKLNEMYLRMNVEMNNSVDYLALMNPPVYNSFETEPRYVNIPLNDSNGEPEDDVELKPMLHNTTENNYVNVGKPVCFMNPGYTEMSRMMKQEQPPFYVNTPLTPTRV